LSEPLPFSATLRARVTANLARFDRNVCDDAELRAAAVALLLVADADGRGCFVLTRRPLTMRRHAGQYALPGGRLDEGETAVQAALRETHEEVGVRLGTESVLGCLDDYATRSGFCITPVVMWGADAVLSPDPNEVAATYRVPLAELMHPDLVHLHSIEESDRPVLALALLGNLIFAPTAALLLQLREVALLGKDTRVDGYEQPLFAWR
jgi:8-oxo-dGTP pyrophosphatase MutT (NUDIX family)